MPGKKGGAAPKKAPGDITKQEAVRRALAELGRDAMPLRIKGFVKNRYGLEMTTNHISTAKGDILRKAKSTALKPAVQQSVESKSEPDTPAPRPQGQPGPAPQAKAIGLDDIEAVKGLLERVGAPALRKLIDVMAR
jgi:hypothetical protein